MKKFLLIVTVIALIAAPVFANGQQEVAKAKTFKAAMATDTGGLGDQSFNDGAYAGLNEAKSKLGAEIKVVESKQMTDYNPNLAGLAEDGNDIVFAIGFLMDADVKEVAANFPDTWFAGIDIGHYGSAPDNFIGITYKEQEAGFLAGVVAGMLTKEYASASPKLNDKNVVGCVLGMDIPPVEKFHVGFHEGVKYVNPTAEILYNYVNDFTNVSLGKEAALAIIQNGADIVFNAAGLTGVGGINACKEAGVYAIGVDVDQNFVQPDTVLTSAMKGISRSVYLAVEEVKNGTAKGGDLVLGINEDAVGIAPYHEHEAMIPQAVKDKVAQVVKDMKAGKITIHTTKADAGIK